MEEPDVSPNNPWSVNQIVEITGGPFNGFKGTILSVDAKKKTVTVKINLRGREIPNIMDFSQIKPLKQE